MGAKPRVFRFQSHFSLETLWQRWSPRGQGDGSVAGETATPAAVAINPWAWFSSGKGTHIDV